MSRYRHIASGPCLKLPVKLDVGLDLVAFTNDQEHTDACLIIPDS